MWMIITWCIIAAFGSLLFLFIFYLLSKLQMTAWMQTIKQLTKDEKEPHSETQKPNELR